MIKVLHFLGTPRATERVLAAARIIRHRGTAVAVGAATGWRQLVAGMTASPGAIPIIDPYVDADAAQIGLSQLRQTCVHEVVVYGDFSGRPVGAVFEWLVLRGRFHHIVTLDTDDRPEQLAAVLMDACGATAFEGFLERCRAFLDWRQLLVVSWALRNGDRRASVEEMARGLGTTSRSLVRWFAKAPGLTPAHVLSWGRVLAACRMIGVAGVDPRQAARTLQFTSCQQMAKECSRLAGVHPMSPTACGDEELLARAMDALVYSLPSDEAPPV